jgi:hypothetical protein
MEKVALDGFWLLGGLALAYLTGVFTSQWVKDKISGVPAELRTAIKATESSALSELTKAKAAVVADVSKLFTKAATATAAAAPAAAAAPVAAAPVAAAPVAAAPAAPAAPLTPVA